MSAVDWDILAQRRSCSLLARRAVARRGTPTAPTTASVIGAIQAQEAVKLLHGMEALLGRGFVFDGARHGSYTVEYAVDPACGWHEPPVPIHALSEVGSETPLRVVWERAAGVLGEVEALDLSRELIERLDCAACGESERVLRPVERIGAEEALCEKCGAERVAVAFHSIGPESDLLERSAREIGLPAWDVVWARSAHGLAGFELAGDDPFSTGGGA